jgi:hypothetical protein
MSFNLRVVDRRERQLDIVKLTPNATTEQLKQAFQKKCKQKICLRHQMYIFCF